MAKKFHVTLSTPGHSTIIQNSGCDILAEYPDTMLIRCDEQQVGALQSQGMELGEAPSPPVRVSGHTFVMEDAVSTESEMPTIRTSRKGYYIVQLVGPSKGEWLRTLNDYGVDFVASLQGDALVLRMSPDKLDVVRSQNWVEGVTTYRPAMKISPNLTKSQKTVLGPRELRALPASETEEANQMVEFTVFPGESVDEITEKLRETGAKIITKSKQSVQAIVSQQTVKAMANENSVETIQPFDFPTFHNDVARGIMDVPTGGAFSSGVLEGTGQIVAVCDSGLDTGNAATVHQDIQGRVKTIVSLGTNWAPDLAVYINGPLNTDDGAADTNSGHGTHVTGSVLGNGAAASGSGAGSIPRGTAPQANLYFQASEQQVNWKPVNQLIQEGIPIPQIPGGWPPRQVGLYGLPNALNDLFNAAYNAGARIHTNSWGAPVGGIYNENSREVDEFMSNNRDMLIVFSAGNSGTDANADAQIDQDSIGSPGTAKNCLTVGASENTRPNGSDPSPGADMTWPQWSPGRFGQMGAAGHMSDNPEGMACFSSRGPTDDGRIKPDVVAPGTNIISTRSSQVLNQGGLGVGPLHGDVLPTSHPLNGDYCFSAGTSMSTPLVAGLAAVVREHLVTQRNHFQDGVKPSGALIKAFLVQGARPLTGQFIGEIPNGPNNVSGFGLTNATETIAPGQLGSMAFDDEPNNAVETGQIRTFSVQASTLAEPLKVTLCWTDPASPGAGGLQNTLYLQVVDPNGVVSNGDVTPFPNVSNNVQQVFIQNPISGQYTIRVRGVSIAQQAPGAAIGPNPLQDFALVMSNGFGLNVDHTQ